MAEFHRDGVVVGPAFLRHHLGVEFAQLGKLVLEVDGSAYVHHVARYAGHNEDVV